MRSELFQLRDGVVGDFMARERGGAHFNGAHPAPFGHWHAGDRLPPFILANGRHGPVFGLYDEVGFFVDDFGIFASQPESLGPDFGRGKIFFARQCALVDPLDDGFNWAAERERSLAKC